MLLLDFGNLRCCFLGLGHYCNSSVGSANLLGNCILLLAQSQPTVQLVEDRSVVSFEIGTFGFYLTFNLQGMSG
jgi:hypothetical protein